MARKQGKHPINALSAVRVAKIHDAGRYADGNGLYLVVDPSGAKRWVLRVVVKGKRRDIGLGGLAVVGLKEARETALQLRKVARQGGDPFAIRRNQRRRIPTFREAAEQVHQAHKATWRNEKHRNQWVNTLTEYVFPKIGNHPVNVVDTADVLRVLSPIWLEKAETARRVRQRIRTVLDWAKAAGYRDGDNPAATIHEVLPKQPKGNKHHTALPYAEVPAFLTQLRHADCREPVRLAFEFLILTAVRTGDVINAQWSEVDLEAKTWTIPGTRMKSKREHRVPLAPKCVEILRQAMAASDGPYLFPGRRQGKPLSNMVFLMTLRRMGMDVTAHGFRSSFRDWASEKTNIPREVCEAALAHVVENKVEAAYRRTDLFDRRRHLMNTWATFATSAKGDVVPIRKTRG